MEEMLSVKDLEVSYGAIHAIKGISFHVDQGEIVTLIGANGAGKTTTLHAISKLLKPSAGEISFCGNPISPVSYTHLRRMTPADILNQNWLKFWKIPGLPIKRFHSCKILLQEYMKQTKLWENWWSILGRWTSQPLLFSGEIITIR